MKKQICHDEMKIMNLASTQPEIRIHGEGKQNCATEETVQR